MKTIILAGGLGTRLSEETVLKPKPMVEIGNMPILWHIMKTYSYYGHNDFAIALGYKGYIIKEFFLNYRLHKSNLNVNIKSGETEFHGGPTEDWNIELCDTGEASMTGGRLLNLKHLFKPGDTFMLTYGDGVSDVNIEALLAFHKSHGKIATLTAVRPPARFGSLEIDDNSVISEFKEKPQIGEGWINGGYFVFNYEVFDYLTNDQTILEREPLENLCAAKHLMAYRHNGFWQCMDTIRDKENLNYIWQQGKAPWKKW
jgi:glucose-1-phosphate cytidylyltransferase